MSWNSFNGCSSTSAWLLLFFEQRLGQFYLHDSGASCGGKRFNSCSLRWWLQMHQSLGGCDGWTTNSSTRAGWSSHSGHNHHVLMSSALVLSHSTNNVLDRVIDSRTSSRLEHQTALKSFQILLLCFMVSFRMESLLRFGWLSLDL